MPTPDGWVIFASAAVAAALAVAVAFQVAFVVRSWRTRRDALRTLGGKGGARDATVDAAVLRDPLEPEEGIFAALAERVPQLRDLGHWTAEAGLDWGIQGFVLRTGFAALVPALGLLLLTASGMAATAAGLGGSVAPWLFVRWKRRRRLRALESQLPGGIDLMARAVRAGHPLSEGLRMVAEEMADPLSAEFRIVFEEQRFGLPFEEALLGLGDRIELVDVRILITAILVQREVGGNLAEILEKIAETMRARFTLRRQVRVYTAQGRMSGYTLAALPIIVGSAIFLINPEYMRTLFDEPIGRQLLTGAAGLQAIGFLWIRRIVDVRY